MSDADASQDQGAKPKRVRKRWLLYLLAGSAALAVAGYQALRVHHASRAEAEADAGPKPALAATSVAKKPAPPTLGIMYEFDRNALLDSRLVGGRLLGLTTSGNLLALDAESFALRKERTLHRRATCLGPADAGHVLAGLANGAIVRVAVEDLSIEPVARVSGIPFWIGARRDGGRVVAYGPEGGLDGVLFDERQGRRYELGHEPVLFLDARDRLWIGNGDKLRCLDLAKGTQKSAELSLGGARVLGFAALADGQVWAFGGGARGSAMAAFVAQVTEAKPSLLYVSAAKPRSPWEPSTPISHVLEDGDRVLVVSRDAIAVSNAKLATWAAFDGIASDGREPGAFLARGQAHVAGSALLLNLVRGGVMEVTSEHARRHLLDGQIPLSRPVQIVRLAGGLAFYGDGGPSFYANGAWRPLPDPIMPPAELMGPGRPGETDRSWVATTTIPIGEQESYVVTKAGPPRHYVGHIHGLRDVVLTARWDGAVLTVLGREELPIEPDDTFTTPDRQLWNVDDQGLWSFDGGHWRLAMRLAQPKPADHPPSRSAESSAPHTGASLRSAIGEPLHFARASAPPFHGLPTGSASWALVRLDSNEAGGVPLIDEIPVKIDGRRALLRDLTVWGNARDSLLLSTDRGLCAFNIKFGNCEIRRPEGLDGEVDLFMRDGTKRLWLGGRGLWVLRDDKHADAVHPFLPMLADTEVISLAEAPDGRLVIGTRDRGAIFLDIPQGWFQRAVDEPATVEPWDAPGAHEPMFDDRGVVLQACEGRAGALTATAMADLQSHLRGFATQLGGRARVELEPQYEGPPDLAVRAPDAEAIWQGLRPLLDKPPFKGRFRVKKRFGAPGSESVEVLSCF